MNGNIGFVAWEGDDYPPYLPLPLGPPVALTLEDSRHYTLGSSPSSFSSPSSSLNSSSSGASSTHGSSSSTHDSSTYQKSPAEVAYEWHSAYPGENLGFVRLGPKKRFFSLALYHQIHCLDSLRKAILAPADVHSHADARNEDGNNSHGARDDNGRSKTKRDSAHSSHCLNYLRQTILCAADLTLEPETEEGSQDVGEGLAVTHVCRDWSKVHRFVESNFEEWWQGQRTNGSNARGHGHT